MLINDSLVTLLTSYLLSALALLSMNATTMSGANVTEDVERARLRLALAEVSLLHLGFVQPNDNIRAAERLPEASVLRRERDDAVSFAAAARQPFPVIDALPLAVACTSENGAQHTRPAMKTEYSGTHGALALEVRAAS